MFPASVKRPALGQLAGLGCLYDARSDGFLQASVLTGPTTEPLVGQTQANTTDSKFSSSAKLKDRLDNLSIGDELGASYLAGLVQVHGAARYLTETIDSRSFVHETLYYNLSTVHERLNLHCSELRNALDFTQLGLGRPTHIVAEILWGASTVVAGKRQLSSTENRRQVEDDLRQSLRKLGTSLIPIDGEKNKLPEQQEVENPFAFTIYSDAIARTDFSANDFESTAQFIGDLPSHISMLNGGKGVPVMYTLLPVSFFVLFFGAQVAPQLPMNQPSAEYQKKFVALLDDIQQAQTNLDSYYSGMAAYRFCLPAQHFELDGKKLRASMRDASDLRSSYSQTIKDIRTGKAAPNELSQLLETYLNGSSAPKDLLALTTVCAEKVQFIDSVISAGGKYIGFSGSSLEATLLKNQHEDAYAFYFSETCRKHQVAWAEHVNLLFDLLKNKSQQALIVIVDGDATENSFQKPVITHFTNAQIFTKDVLEQQKLLADKCIMRYDASDLDTSFRDVPAQRKMVKIPCPGPQCDPDTSHDWICGKCHAPTEYSSLDQAVYCDCGRCPYSSFSFKCKAKSHSVSYERFKRRALLQLLEELPSPGELNILILGETGVGKSTFINAFVNYLTFATLEEGMNATRLNSIIPCSFSTQYVDPASGGRLVQKQVRIGYDDDERDGAGQSATQKTTVYPLYINNTLVRLIDTPGIGDTRGIEQDRKNMVDVLSVLRNYDKLHGILILLKPNNSRLTVMFRFCVKELLTHLHRSAARNMVFGEFFLLLIRFFQSALRMSTYASSGCDSSKARHLCIV